MTDEICDIDELAKTIGTRAAELPGRVALVGIDGPGASGKSTLATLLAERLDDAAVVHIDDFYRPSAERPADAGQIAGNFDLSRLLDQVLRPAAAGTTIRYQRYDWDHDRLAEWAELAPGTPLIVEGVHALHPDLSEAYTYRIFCDAPRDVRLRRGLDRDGEEARPLWEDEWMPAEDRYLAAHAPQLRADVVLESSASGAAEEPAYAVVDYNSLA
ncbi:uridine kinase [Kitasatospora sp. NPDC089509]|uniref:uridine kinase family protein n=1 Tax=Kitasatospora sp. NPDC089509 TaxID=3364079 RepID=UPI0038126B07